MKEELIQFKVLHFALSVFLVRSGWKKKDESQHSLIAVFEVKCKFFPAG